MELRPPHLQSAQSMPRHTVPADRLEDRHDPHGSSSCDSAPLAAAAPDLSLSAGCLVVVAFWCTYQWKDAGRSLKVP